MVPLSLPVWFLMQLFSGGHRGEYSMVLVIFFPRGQVDSWTIARSALELFLIQTSLDGKICNSCRAKTSAFVYGK
jgi:hypothetical protein